MSANKTNSTPVISRCEDLPPNFSSASVREMPWPRSVVMCTPTYFDVVDVKNVFMAGQLGNVDHNEASRQWEELKTAFDSKGIDVEVIDPLEGCEDMVFCANPIFPGIDESGRRKCVLSKMNHSSRQKEVAAVASWFDKNGYELIDLRQQPYFFEGGGDAIWHPGRAMIWGGHGQRTQPEVYEALAKIFDVPIMKLQIVDARFYHLDTCFCPLDSETVLVYSPAFTAAGLSLIRQIFQRVVEVDETETVKSLACNATSLMGKYIFIQRGAMKTIQELSDLKYEITEVETGEFLKSGGSVFCMKSALF